MCKVIWYLSSRGRRPVRLPGWYPGVDVQGCVPAGWCVKCGGEVFSPGEELCLRCLRKECESLKKHLSPCLTCTRVADPESCTDKSCRVWQNWFLQQWDRVRALPRLQKEEPAENLGVPLGGNHYAAPHQVEAYLQKDPCEDCLCPRDLCGVPCRKRRVWEQTNGEVSK